MAIGNGFALYPSEKGANDTVKTVIHKLNSWIQAETDGDPENIVAGYKLDGTPTQDYDDLCFTAPFLVAAACEDSASSWEQALWDTLADYGTDVYFGDTIRMLCMISVTGNWLVPDTATVPQRAIWTVMELPRFPIWFY